MDSPDHIVLEKAFQNLHQVIYSSRHGDAPRRFGEGVSDQEACSRFISEHVKDLIGMDISHVTMDKGYDGEPTHRYVRRNLNCVTVIPCRESRRNRGYSTHGIYRNQMKKALKEEGELKKIYNQRPQVETTNFMIKTHTGSHVLSRLDRTKVVQTLCKVITHNCKIVSERGWS